VILVSIIKVELDFLITSRSYFFFGVLKGNHLFWQKCAVFLPEEISLMPKRISTALIFKPLLKALLK
jgi:hypothetical protein